MFGLHSSFSFGRSTTTTIDDDDERVGNTHGRITHGSARARPFFVFCFFELFDLFLNRIAPNLKLNVFLKRYHLFKN
jgi:hypothetical protein